MKEEQKYLEKVELAIDKNIENWKNERDEAKKMSTTLLAERAENFYMLDNDMSASDSAYYINKIDDADATVENLTKKIEIFEKTKDRPYFARIDFKENGADAAGKYYIGLHYIALDKTAYVYDWRAPISSLYYNYDEGKASFTAPDGEVEGEITLKRQYNIENGKLNYYINTKETINDEILQEVLSKHASPKMRQIVSTIQKEQNAIIREENFRTILVQGVAGSGKTSIALHRAGYLLYNHRDDFSSSDVLILSPSNLFSNYVSDVLPELGEDNVIEMTFSHIARTELKRPVESRENLMDEVYKDKNQTKLNEIAYKSSFDYLNALTKFLTETFAAVFNPRDMLFKPADAKEDSYNAFYFSKEEMKKLYFESFATLPINKRIEYMTDILIERFGLSPKETELIKPRFKSMLYRFFPLSDIYKICEVFYSRENLSVPSFDKLAYEDVATLLMIKQFIFGLDHDFSTKYVIIDEMQDFTPVHFYLFNKIWDCPKIILGDINQCIEKTLSKKYLLELSRFLKAKLIVLNKTYRSTRQISQFSQKLIGLKGVINMNREGEEPELIKTTDTARTLLRLIDENRNKFEHTAIVCKTSDEVKKVAKMLDGKEKYEVIVGSDFSFDFPLVITTAATSKGIEFDHVIVPFADKENYRSELDKNMLYVATTRALHKLEFVFEGQKSKFLKKV